MAVTNKVLRKRQAIATLQGQIELAHSISKRSKDRVEADGDRNLKSDMDEVDFAHLFFNLASTLERIKKDLY